MKPLPQQLLQDLQQVPQFDERSFATAHQAGAATSVRLHPLKASRAFAAGELIPWCADGRYLQERPIFTLDPLFHAGAYYVQEASSMFLDYLMRTLLPERNNLRVLDLCAAPGGKSTLIASLLGPDSLLISNEVIRTRAPILQENMAKWGYMNTWVTSNDAREFGKLPGYFDAIVVDAPCSGSGLFRKDEKAIDEWSEANVQLCSQRQQRILADAWPSLKEDGILLYATCSYSPAEDEEILDWLAASFGATGIDVGIPEEWGIVKTYSPSGNMCGYRFFPDKLKGEGFFIAAIRKAESEDTVRQPKYKTTHDKKAAQQAAFLLNDDNWLCIKNNEDSFSAINPLHEADLHILRTALYLRKSGLELGTPTAKDWIPAHEVALSVNKSLKLPFIELNREQALRFLKKEEITLSSSEKGWYQAGYNGLGLGWLKALGNRTNNYMPKNWRIRMDIDFDQA